MGVGHACLILSALLVSVSLTACINVTLGCTIVGPMGSTAFLLCLKSALSSAAACFFCAILGIFDGLNDVQGRFIGYSCG